MNHTALYESHLNLGAKMVAFAGWKMPFSYTNPTKEHLNVRSHGGLFDVSHMGEIRIRGPQSLDFLAALLPSSIQSLEEGRSQYSFLCTEQGYLIDDLIVYCFKKEEDYLLCVNAATKDKDFNFLKSHLKNQDLEMSDESSSWGMIAVQGPKSLLLCEEVFPDIKFSSIKKFHFASQNSIIFSRTGYTGEEGFEIYIPWNQSESVWKAFLEKAQAFSIQPTGLGARDTLRLEMAYLLSGQDFDESRNPLEAGLSWVMKNPKNYVGKQALLNQKKRGESLKAFIMKEALGVPRKGYSVVSSSGKVIGKVTSGAKSPSLEKMIGLAYIKEQDEDCFLEIRESKAEIEIVSGPFLKKES
ncbi:MAG: glycine cleavage system aminomethyltransferase GcvT [Bdellovibrionales bacterium]